MYFSLAWLPNTLFLSFCLRPLIRLCLALSHLCYSYCKLCLALSHLCYSYCKHAIQCIIFPRNSLENIVNFGILIPQILLFNKTSKRDNKTLVTQPMLQLRPNWSELRSMDSYIQILCRFQKCKRKVPPPSLLSTKK